MIFWDKQTHNGSLLDLVVKGGFWVFILRISQKVLSVVRIIILANILSPHDFGLVGIAFLVMATLETFSQTGFQQALVQKKGNITKYLDAVWTVLILRGIILFLILFFSADAIAAFFNTPLAKPIIQVISLSIVFKAITNVGVIYFEKELKFNKQFIYQLCGTLADFMVSIFSVLIIRNVWALVFGLLAGNFVKFVLSYHLHPYRPQICIDFAKMRELFGFGKWIFGSSILVFLLTQGDDILVGKLLGVSCLGFYQMAYKISNMPATEISHLIATVTFPAYSKIQDNLFKLKEAYLKVLQITAFLSIPVAGLIFILAPEFIKLFLGNKWMPMLSALQVLAIYGLLRALGATTGVVFMAVGRPKIRTKIQAAQLVLLAMIIYPLIMRWGITGAAVAVTSYALIFNFVAIAEVLNIVRSEKSKPLLLIICPLLCTLVMVGTIFALKTYLFDRIALMPFFFLVFGGIVSYIGAVYLADLFLNYGYKQLMSGQITDFIRGHKLG